MSGFAPGTGRWIERLGNLRNVIRQEVIARQLAGFVQPGMTVLDVGCGQGTQTVELASKGCVVTGVEPADLARGRTPEEKDMGFGLVGEVRDDVPT